MSDLLLVNEMVMGTATAVMMMTVIATVASAMVSFVAAALGLSMQLADSKAGELTWWLPGLLLLSFAQFPVWLVTERKSSRLILFWCKG